MNIKKKSEKIHKKLNKTYLKLIINFERKCKKGFNECIKLYMTKKFLNLYAMCK